MLSVKSNMLAVNANRQLNVNTQKSAKNAEKLSSGYKINRAADDAAGLGISEKMRRQIRGLHQGADNIQDGIGYVQTADGALNEAQEILQRINELSVKAANGTNTEEDRFYIDQEIQQLKTELARIFDTTTYNEIKIWESNDRKIIGYNKVQAVRFNYITEPSLDITDNNCDVIAKGSYQIHASKDDGVKITWTGYDGESYETEPISWAELKKYDYSFEMSDYFGDNGFLYNADGEPLFQHRISLSVQPTATIDDIIACIDGVTFSSTPHTSLSGRFEDKDGKPVDRDVSVSASLIYNAAYESHINSGHTFDDADDIFFEPRGANGATVQGDNASANSNLTSRPSASTVEQARNSNEGWTFTFYMEGIGEVTATSSSASYYAPNDKADDDYGYWWEWGHEYRNGKWVQTDEREYFSRSINATLGGIMDALTGRKGEDPRPGLLSHNNGGDADNGGYINIYFNLTSKNYGSVGSFTLGVKVKNTDTEESVLKKIQEALNKDTILDFYTSSSASDGAAFSHPYEKSHIIDAPIYGGICGFFVEAGPEAGEHIDIQYESLHLLSLGLYNTNVRTVEAANRAIGEVKKGLQIVSEQRATFGAYQNRLEHAQKINQNSEENTQYAESSIRNTDIATTMVKYANQSILSQAGVSMLAQANQQPGFIMQLLQ